MSVLCFPFSENDYFPQYECDDAIHLTHTQPNIDMLSCDLYVTRFGCKSQCPGEQTFFVVTKSNISLLEERMAQTAECHLPNISLTSAIPWQLTMRRFVSTLLWLHWGPGLSLSGLHPLEAGVSWRTGLAILISPGTRMDVFVSSCIQSKLSLICIIGLGLHSLSSPVPEPFDPNPKGPVPTLSNPISSKGTGADTKILWAWRDPMLWKNICCFRKINKMIYFQPRLDMGRKNKH